MDVVTDLSGIVHTTDMIKLEVFDSVTEDLVDEGFFETERQARDYHRDNFSKYPFNLYRVEHFKRTKRIN